jgi:DNA-binding response OmpR family regulator
MMSLTSSARCLTEFSPGVGDTRAMTDSGLIDAAAKAAVASVLVVDDDVKLASVMVRFLDGAGYACVTAHSGDEALWATNTSTPDAIVMDVMIPHPSGIEVCRHLRASGYRGPIVVISARSTPADREAAARGGATDFLAKPFPLAKLASVLSSTLAAGLKK